MDVLRLGGLVETHAPSDRLLPGDILRALVGDVLERTGLLQPVAPSITLARIRASSITRCPVLNIIMSVECAEALSGTDDHTGSNSQEQRKHLPSVRRKHTGSAAQLQYLRTEPDVLSTSHGINRTIS